MDLPKNIINSQALLIALDRQPASLPESLQWSLTQIGRAWQTHPTEENANILRQLIKGNESLEAAYMSAVVELRRAYTSQERTTSLDATLPIETRLDDYLLDLLSSENWVETAKQTKRSIENFTHSLEQLVGEKNTETSIFGKVLSAFQGWQTGAAKTSDRPPSSSIIAGTEISIESNLNVNSLVDEDEDLESPAESFRQGWADVVAGNTIPVSQLWD
jgi:hypothetical protein